MEKTSQIDQVMSILGIGGSVAQPGLPHPAAIHNAPTIQQLAYLLSPQRLIRIKPRSAIRRYQASHAGDKEQHDRHAGKRKRIQWLHLIKDARDKVTKQRRRNHSNA